MYRIAKPLYTVYTTREIENKKKMTGKRPPLKCGCADVDAETVRGCYGYGYG